jgi:hypothetical protein
MKLFTLSLLTATLVLAGCHHSSDAVAPDTQQASSQASTKDEAKPFGQQAPVSQVDRATPLTSYTQVTDPSWLTYIFVSREDPQPSDEEKMKLFSPAYFNEADSFKQHDLLVSGLPKVNTTLAEYKAQSYYTFQTDDPLNAGIVTLKPYDFASQSFQIAECRPNLLQFTQGIQLKIPLNPKTCEVKVTDATLARTIENLRAHYQIKLTFTTSFFVDGVESNGNLVNGTLMHFHVDVSNVATHQPITSVDLQ